MIVDVIRKYCISKDIIHANSSIIFSDMGEFYKINGICDVSKDALISFIRNDLSMKSELEDILSSIIIKNLDERMMIRLHRMLFPIAEFYKIQSVDNDFIEIFLLEINLVLNVNIAIMKLNQYTKLKSLVDTYISFDKLKELCNV